MSKKQILVPVVSTIFGAFIMWLSVFTISDIMEYAPSYTAPLTEEQFADAQKNGEVTFNGVPAPDGLENSEVVIRCHKNISVCNVVAASVTEYTSGPVLGSTLTDYEIRKWSDEGVIQADHETHCGSYSLEANVKTREVFVGYKSYNNTSDDDCAVQPYDGKSKLDFGQPRTFFGGLKSDIHYFIGELFYKVYN